MKLKQTIAMMQSGDFKERFRAEYFQIKIRLERLRKMLKGYKEKTLQFEPNCNYELLHTQSVYMECYLNTLEERAKIENIDLEK